MADPADYLVIAQLYVQIFRSIRQKSFTVSTAKMNIQIIEFQSS